MSPAVACTPVGASGTDTPPPPPAARRATPKMVPPSSATVGLELASNVSPRHPGRPLVSAGCPTTTCHAPPVPAFGFHHCSDVPPLRLQSLITTFWNVLALD